MAIESDFLIIGSGIAGLSFALQASQFGSVTIITKKENTESNTNYAQGGIATVIHPKDSVELHIDDTLKAGAGLCNREAVDALVKEGPDRVKELIEWGVHFSKKRVKGGSGAVIWISVQRDIHAMVEGQVLAVTAGPADYLDTTRIHRALREFRLDPRHCPMVFQPLDFYVHAAFRYATQNLGP